MRKLRDERNDPPPYSCCIPRYYILTYLLVGRSQDRIDGTGAEERGGAGIVAGRDTQEHRMLRAQGPGSAGVGK